MKSSKHLGISLGFLAGTTFGSGIAFLFRFEPAQLMFCVAICGLIGITSGLLTITLWHSRV